MAPATPKDILILTIGHSTRPIEKFAGLLLANDVQTLVDVRTAPRSRHNPHFNMDALPAFLEARRIGYTHMTGAERPAPSPAGFTQHGVAQ